MAKKKNITNNDIISCYMDYVLEHNHEPKTIYAFAKANNFEEQKFYEFFSSFESVEKQIFKAFFDNTHAILEQNDDYMSFDARNKLLSFYFTFFENLTANRSYVVYVLDKHKNSLKGLNLLSDLKHAFINYIEHLGIELIEVKQEQIDKIQRRGLKESAWLQLLLTMKFWIDDTSPSFEKTDIFIEKSINTSFDILDVAPIKSIIDFGKFIFKEKNTHELNLLLMKTIDKIPTSKIQRATKLVSTGAKVGVNYLKYYGDKITKTELEAKERLNENNASDIYDGLKQLKGSALKVAQMLSMEKSIMPQAYVEKFSLAQFSVPPLSPPLVMKTFKKYFGKLPNELYDTFNATSVNAASIGQVHMATKDGKKLAVKIQYPGVAESIASDLAMVKPIAMSMFNIKGKGSDKYFKEVENKLVEETDYILEVEQSKEIVDACSHIPNLKFPQYYDTLSNERIITMDYMEGEHLSEFVVHNTNQEHANTLGQALWDFYMYQIHNLKKVHADPHPGNFLISETAELIALDFGCMKIIPEEFYKPYFELAQKDNITDKIKFEKKLYELEILREDDSKEEIAFFTEMFHEMLSLFTQPLHAEVFDFSDDKFFGKIAALGEKYSKNTELRKMNGNRGSKHFIYMNRTFFGLNNLMFDLKAKNIKINNFRTL